MSDVTEKPDARETVDRWESTEAFTATCNAVDAICRFIAEAHAALVKPDTDWGKIL